MTVGTRGPGRRLPALLAGLLLAAAVGGCSTVVAQPVAPPTTPRAAPYDPSATPALVVAEHLDELAEKVTGGRADEDVPGLAGLSVDEERGALDVWWVGEPPQRVRRLAAAPPDGLTMRIHPATYDVAAMVAALDKVMDRYDVIHAASPGDDGDGIDVEMTARSARSGPTRDQLAKVAGMPVRIIISEPPQPA